MFKQNTHKRLNNLDESSENFKSSVTAIIVAAGNSTRMELEESKSKQFIEIGGIPVIGRTLMAFESCFLVDDIVVVAREEDIIKIWDIIRFYEIEKVAKVVTGGETRQQSVLKGIRACNEDTQYYCIHDGARPLVSPESITKVILCAKEKGAATLGVKIKDTVKKVDSGVITDTLNRDELYLVQTPQVFTKNIYKEALSKAIENNVDATDDCKLVENIGVPVVMVDGDYLNIKITTREDVVLADGIASVGGAYFGDATFGGI